MTDFLNRISSYNIFNNLFPGVLLVGVLNYLGLVQLNDLNLFVQFFLFYFAGMTVSRIGSVLIEPIFKFIGIVRYAQYSDYIDAAGKDAKIETLLEANNTYRTIVALFFCALVVLCTEYFFSCLQLSVGTRLFAYLFVVFCIYVAAYRKQTDYVRKRVEKIIKALPQNHNNR
jgi:hypothetical protein